MFRKIDGAYKLLNLEFIKQLSQYIDYNISMDNGYTVTKVKYCI